ncbi:hypothetical protein C0Q70_05663 [Pomacea canaliculata]|uniref:Mitochondrial import inner membrane translocase subunit n=1 Tax=Pomacea canaliculata TaxID=400727 RepID=A0A2T7PLT9_POMCA|nr:mitochondrial import inner membrane translocase subunit Tim9-like [Pomacea canaliculata]PVD34391.1 hypothetical protein C0Q70_05663 [Pomacea canaliculata]
MNQFPDEVHNRTMRDFLELYNKLTHHCFDACVKNFNYRDLTTEEVQCVNCCSDKYIGFNQRHMLIFMDYQNKKQKIAAAAAAAVADVQGGTTPIPAESAAAQLSSASDLTSVADKMLKQDSVTSTTTTE